MLANSSLTALQQMEIDELDELFEILGMEPGDVIDKIDEMDEPEVKQRFEIKDLEQLNWAFRKLSALATKKAEVDKLHKAEVDRINVWKEKELKSIEDNKKFFEMLVSQYAREKREADPKYKGDKTPYGKIGFRKQQPGWNFEDEEKVVEFLENNGHEDHVKTVKTIENKTSLKKYLSIKRNVFVKVGEEFNIVVDAAAEVDEIGAATGMEYKTDGLVVVMLETGEVVKDVFLKDIVVVDPQNKVVPFVVIEDKPDAVDVKPEA